MHMNASACRGLRCQISWSYGSRQLMRVLGIEVRFLGREEMYTLKLFSLTVLRCLI